ncbi:mucin-21-like [Galleria mellonella]|uniref:Mucin-21-like n=1 Tax=Galleria mellonella TaxID=7137 RepID=A0A6J1WCU2_GALME|nr:mucin-21-like [Galleria mellonella]
MKMLYKLVCLCWAVSYVLAAPSPKQADQESEPTVIPIVSQSDELEPNGTYRFSYETGNGIKREEVAYDKVLPKAKGRSANSNEGGENSDSDESNEIHVQKGSYSYTAPDGTVITVRYIADENGFRPIGKHLPRVPKVTSDSASSGEKTGRALNKHSSGKSKSAPAIVARSGVQDQEKSSSSTPSSNTNTNNSESTTPAPLQQTTSPEVNNTKSANKSASNSDENTTTKGLDTTTEEASTVTSSDKTNSEATTTVATDNSAHPETSTITASSNTTTEISSTAAKDESTTTELGSTVSFDVSSTPVSDSITTTPSETVSTTISENTSTTSSDHSNPSSLESSTTEIPSTTTVSA